VVEHFLGKEEVGGSIPLNSSKEFKKLKKVKRIVRKLYITNNNN
jgi:hypothetical protein